MNLFKRVLKNGWKNFSGSFGLSFATVFVMILVISTITILYFLNPISDMLVKDVEEKVDVSVYFKEETDPEDILEVKSEIVKIPEVEEVNYISKEEAFESFMDRHKEDHILIDSLAEVGYNPFLASLSVKAKEASRYEQVAVFLETGPFKELVDKIDYHQRKPVIEKVFAFTKGVKNIAFFFSMVFGIIALIIAFNTVKIAIQSSKEEISIMRLVGASNWFVRGPFIIQGLIAGSIAALITFVLTFVASHFLDSNISSIIPSVSLLGIFSSNLLALLLIQLLSGAILGTASSLIAVRKYLKI
ncbi:MAG: hypothetical protein A2365_01670 [Candidatus Nealsonbacteria bacterium RIFOXYB1_FULL_40_15]|uniref:Cell division protein FtsX n=1 Tax=Candidatus Nealsonbacteria bacterium RIFOXYB1_FULL_40_15 TaxID=1801677 RepID=A0A1G2EP30_9BACT|nr:MAG: hypothetical protein A2365_01670 [Candidatus Nealsonbacteria bacterium RIFOXYB1_FULL_40_15]OGZ28278.1 MAG: hypothetical protein A2562_04370 [Candidatus Nealsonbacteria bacterium RIFOXYD1_FULL_39_11]